MKTEKIIKDFKKFSESFNNGQGLKEQTILKDLELYNPKYEEGIGILLGNKNNPQKIFISHIDLIPLFNIDNLANLIFEKEDLLVGPLDNTITNAVLVNLIMDLYKNQEEIESGDILFLFSEGEEIGGVGVRNFMNKYYENVKNSFFINLDVTNEFWSDSVSSSIEFDYPSLNILHALEEELPHDFGMTNNRVFDDLSLVLNKSVKSGFSCCLPTTNIIHSFNNTTKISFLEEYYQNLMAIAKSDKINVLNYKDDSETILENTYYFAYIHRKK